MSNSPDYGLLEPITMRPDGRTPVGSRSEASVEDYDNYFRIRRDYDPARWSAAAARVARQVSADLGRTSLGPTLQRDLLNGVALLLVDTAPSAERAVAPRPDNRLPLAPEAVAAFRWKVGHHLFHLMLSCMNSGLDASVRAVESGDLGEGSRLVNHVAKYLSASTAAMHYASDFPREQYEKLIRPSMEPPWMPPGFSGIFNAEHNSFERGMGALRRSARSVGSADEFEAALMALRREQSRNRREHRLICEKFVPGGDSLLKQHFSSKSTD